MMIINLMDYTNLNNLSKNYIAFLISLLYTIYQFDNINYPQDQNPDILNYISNYINANWSYDLGFEFYQSLFRDYFHIDFYLFWVVTLLIICGLYLAYSRTLIQIPFYIINLTFMAVTLGTQIRYFLGVVLFIYSIDVIKSKYFKYLLLCLSCLVHYGITIAFVIYIFAIWFSKNNMPSLFFENKFKILFVSIMLFFALFPVLSYLIVYTRFSYYEDSHYMDSKSLSSFIYIVLNFIVLLFISRAKLFTREQNKIIFVFSIMLLIFCYTTSSIAVLSGRVLLFYVMLEPVTVKYIFDENKIDFFYIVMFVLSLSKLIPMIISMFYFSF